MRQALSGLLLAAAATAACAPHRPEARVHGGADLAAYRRLAVLPFGDRAGEGRAYAPAAAKALYAMGYDVAPPEAVESLLRGMGVRPGEPVGAPTLQELRARTRAAAAVYGTVDCVRGAPRVTMVLVDTRSAEALFDMAYAPRRCGGEAGAEEAASRLAARLRREVGDRLTGRTEGALK